MVLEWTDSYLTIVSTLALASHSPIHPRLSGPRPQGHRPHSPNLHTSPHNPSQKPPPHPPSHHTGRYLVQAQVVKVRRYIAVGAGEVCHRRAPS